MIVLKNLTADNAYNVCEKLRVAIETNEVDSKSVTMSFGLFHVSHSFIQENQNLLHPQNCPAGNGSSHGA